MKKIDFLKYVELFHIEFNIHWFSLVSAMNLFLIKGHDIIAFRATYNITILKTLHIREAWKVEKEMDDCIAYMALFFVLVYYFIQISS